MVRMTAESENARIEQERHRRILTTLRRERELRDRSDNMARRSLERANSVMERARDRLRDDIINEFVREERGVSAGGEDENAGPAGKRPRLETEEERHQYDKDMREAIDRSLRDQTPSTSTPAAEDSEPQPGCSHWGLESQSSTPTQASVPSPAVPSPAAPAPAVAAAAPAVPEPDYEALYKAQLTKHQKLVQDLQSSLECPVCLETIRSAPAQCCRNGHLICNVCITRAQICPTCRAPMGGSAFRCVSHLANRLVDLLPHPCTNKDRGK